MSTLIQLTIDDIPENILIYRYINENFVLVDMNKMAESSRGVQKEEVLDHVLDKNDSSAKKFYEKLWRVHQFGDKEECELNTYKDKKLYLCQHHNISKLPNGDIITLYRDITRKKRYEIKLRQQTQQFEEAQKIANFGSWEWDIETNEITWSDEVFRIFGEEIQSFSPSYEIFLSYLNEKDVVSLQERITYAKIHKKPYSFEHQIMGKDGNCRSVRETGKLYYDNEGKALKMIGTILDITERKEIKTNLKEGEEKFRILSQSDMMGIFIYNKFFTYVNEAFIKMTGYSSDELYKMAAWEVIEPSLQSTIKSMVQRRIKGDKIPQKYNDLKIVTKEGVVKTVRVITQTISHHGKYSGMGTMIDITDIEETKEKLKLLAQAMEQMDELVRITDKNGVILYINEALIRHTGFTRRDLIGHKINIFKSGKHSPTFYKDLWKTVLSGKTYKGIFVNQKKDNSLYYEEEVITPIKDQKNKIIYFIATSQDITKRIQMEEKLYRLATIDELTEIYNRHKINEEINIGIDRVKRYKETFVLIMFDIDFFKVVNDSYGHDVGDFVLKELSRLVLNNIRESDRFGRWGGEEFMLVLPHVDKKQALFTAEKLREAVSSHDFKEAVHITISMGVVCFEKGDTKETVLKRVDKALYQAKEEGRDRVVFL
ncbi:diguanylate cyclase [Sulfurimonas sp. MAG313]|nr:diguanylate cyclase [Sulfurimonas sp. MAG313]MDF1879849.1 diguanylate cyclase [Sulfurimonas sp. MAG313]